MKNKYKQILTFQRCFFDFVEHEITVKNINGKFHCRVFTNGILNQEAICYNKQDIAFTCRNLLRTEDKCGNLSKLATKARERLNEEWTTYCA